NALLRAPSGHRVYDRVTENVADRDARLFSGAGFEFKHELRVDRRGNAVGRKWHALFDGPHLAILSDKEEIERHGRVLHPKAELLAYGKDEEHAAIVIHCLAEHQPALTFVIVIRHF